MIEQEDDISYFNEPTELTSPDPPHSNNIEARQLQSIHTINPFEDVNDYGYELYKRARAFCYV